MMQDPKKEARDYEKTSLKDKLKQYSTVKKAPLKEITEMGKPNLKAKFEAAMQKERDFVLNRAKQRDQNPDWYRKEAIRESLIRGDKGNMKEYFRSVLKELPSKEVKVLVKKEGIGKEMAEKKYLKPRIGKGY